MSYYGGRKHMSYYGVLREILESLGPRESILDIGAWDTPCATYGLFNRRMTIDMRSRPQLEGVTAIVGTWPEDAGKCSLPVSVVTCCQVLEHLADPSTFARAMFEAAVECVIISVPYRWPASACEYHLHDPIDEQKLAQLIGRSPSQSAIVREPDGWHRLIAVYEVVHERG